MLGNIRRGAEGRKEARANPYICKKKKEAVAKKKESGVCGDEWSTDYLYPRMLEIAKWRF